MSNTEKTSADTTPVINAAAKLAIEFDRSEAERILTAMAEAQTNGESSKAERDNLSLEFCMLAITTREANASIERDTVAKGFSAELDILLPRMAVQGSPFVEVSTDKDGNPRYAWKGHGANVKSIAKGCAEFYQVVHTDDDGNEFDALIDVSDAESFTAVKKSVEAARRYSNESDEQRELREVKEQFRDAIKTYASLVIGENDAELISLASIAVDDLADTFADDLAAQTAIENAAESTPTVVMPDAIDGSILVPRSDLDEDIDDDESEDTAATG